MDKTLPFDRAAHAVRLAAGLVIACGLIVLAGWLLEIEAIKSVLPGVVAMKANTAVCFILSGLSLWFAACAVPPELQRPIRTANLAVGSAILVMLVAGATALQYLTGRDFGIDEILFRDLIHNATAYPGRMSPITACNFLCMASALILLARRRDTRWVQALALIPALITLGVVVGTSYGIASLQVSGRLTAVAVHTSAAFLVLCAGIVCASGREGIMRLLTDQGAAGKVVRRICPAAILVPTLLGYLRIWGERQGFFGTESGVALFSVFNIVAFTSLVWWNARRLSDNEAETGRVSGALRESQERYTFLADAMPQIVWSARSDGGVEYFNKGGYTYSGMSEEEVTNWGWGKMVHPDDLPAVIARWKSSLLSGEALEAECRVRRAADGVYRWHIVRGAAQRNETGEIIQWVGSCTDIDDHKRAEDALRESEERLHLVFDNLTEGLFISDIDGRLLHWNKAGLALHGLDSLNEGLREQFEFQEIFELSTLAGRVLPLDQWPLSRVLRGEPLRNFEVRIRRIGTDWERIFLAGGSLVHDGRGKPLAFVTFTDITERQAAQMTAQRMAAIVDSSSDAIFGLDLNNMVTTWNIGAERLFGYSASEMVGTSVMRLSPPERRAEAEQILSRIRHGERVDSMEAVKVRKDGTLIDVSITVSPIKDAAGNVIGASKVARDMTARKQVEAALREAKTDLEQKVALRTSELLEAKESAESANRSKSSFLANMSHEIRTPMNGVIGMASLLIDTPLTEEQHDYIQTIRASGESLLTIINDILDFSKIEAGKLNLEVLDFDLMEVFESTLELLADTAQSKGIELAGLMEPSVPTRLRGDATRLRQVLTNLVGNAIKFTAQGEVAVRVVLEKETDSEASLLFHIRDTGIGIAPESQRMLFQAFSQADLSTSRKFGGTGLGLAICKQLVVKMGGTIGVESELGKGSTFWFSLPLQKQAGSHAERTGREHAMSGVRVLIVDDNVTSATFLAAELKAWKISTQHALSGSEALACLQLAVQTGMPFKLAIIDLGMPEMDGLTLARAIKSNPDFTAMRLVMLTTRGRLLSEADLRDAGISQCRLKPLRQSSLFDCLASALAEVPSRGRTIVPGTAAPRRAERILLAEDSAVNQRVALGQLRKLGFYAADAVANGLEALQALGQIDYDVVLMDCQMPEMDGYETARAIREREGSRKHTWIIAMTANAMSGDCELCLAAGMDDYLSKPVRLEDLAAALERALSRHSGSPAEESKPTAGSPELSDEN